MSEQPPSNPYQPYGVTGPTGPDGRPLWAPDHPQATTVLLLGILGLAVCQLCAPFAWVMGARVRREIDESGGRYGARSQAQVGYVLGIVGSVLLIVGVLFALLYVIIIVAAVSTSV